MQHRNGVLSCFNWCAMRSRRTIRRKSARCRNLFAEQSHSRCFCSAATGKPHASPFPLATGTADFHQLRIAQHPSGQTFDLRQQRGGEKEESVDLSRSFNDPTHVGRKPCPASGPLRRGPEFLSLRSWRAARADRATARVSLQEHPPRFSSSRCFP